MEPGFLDQVPTLALLLLDSPVSFLRQILCGPYRITLSTKMCLSMAFSLSGIAMDRGDGRSKDGFRNLKVPGSLLSEDGPCFIVEGPEARRHSGSRPAAPM